jgi:hypothetical protein
VVVDKYESLDLIVESASENLDKRILVDLAAQTHNALVKWMDESGVLEMTGEMGLSLCYWHVMDSGKDSVDLLKTLLDRFGARLNYVLVLNEGKGAWTQRADHFPEAIARGGDYQDRRGQHELLGGEEQE